MPSPSTRNRNDARSSSPLADDAVDGAILILDAGESDVLVIAVGRGVAGQAGVQDAGAAGGVDGGDAAVAEGGAGLGQEQATVGSEGNGAGMVQAGEVEIISPPGEQIGTTTGAGGEGRDGEGGEGPGEESPAAGTGPGGCDGHDGRQG